MKERINAKYVNNAKRFSRPIRTTKAYIESLKKQNELGSIIKLHSDYVEDELAEIRKKAVEIKQKMMKELRPSKLTNRDKSRLEPHSAFLSEANRNVASSAKRNIVKPVIKDFPGFVFNKISCLDSPKLMQTTKKLIIGKEKQRLWSRIRPYYGYCLCCADKNYKYGALLCGKHEEQKILDVNWQKVIDQDEC